MLYGRKIKLLFYLYGESVGLSFTLNSEDFDIKLDVKKTTGVESNKGEVSIYNLSKEKQELLEGKPLSSVDVQIGYGSFANTSTCFIGDIGDVKVSKEGGDVKTTITLSTTLALKNTLDVSKSFAGGVDLLTIINYTSATMGLALQQPLKVNNHVWRRGVTISGNLLEWLSRTCDEVGNRMVVQDNVLHVWKAGVSTFLSEVVSLSSNSGLVGVPEAISEKNDDRIEDEKTNPTAFVEGAKDDQKTSTVTGFKIKSLMNSEIKIGTVIILTSEVLNEAKTQLYVDEVRHVGGSTGTEFYTECKAYRRSVNG